MTDPIGKYINPFTDFGFKKLFGTAFNKALLIDFLNQVLGGKEKISDLTYLNNEAPGKTKFDRAAIFDLHCRNEQGEVFIVELQNVKQDFFIDRSIYYSTFPIQSQAVKGKPWDYKLKAVYTIGILNFSFTGEETKKRFFREVKLVDVHTYEIFYEKLTFMYLEIPNFKKGEDELETLFDKWLFVLKNLSKLQERPKKLQEKIFAKLFEEAEIAKLNPKDMKKYEESLKIYRDNYNTLEYAKKEGREEGRLQGREEGRKEVKNEMIKAMLKNGMSIELIAELSGLSKAEIERLES